MCGFSRQWGKLGLICGVFSVLCGTTRNDPAFSDVKSSASAAGQMDQKEAEGKRIEDERWSHLKNIAIGEARLDIGAGLRLRGEILDGFNIKKYDENLNDALLLERVRIEMALRYHGFRIFVQGQDAREFGCDLSNSDFTGSSPYNNDFDLRQAYIENPHVADTPFGFRVGRQSIAYTDNRLMGPGEWGNVGRYVWDAALLTWRSERFSLDLFEAIRVKYEPTRFDEKHYDYDLAGMYSTLEYEDFKFHAFYFLKMNNFVSKNADGGSEWFHRHSPGLSMEGTFEDRFDCSMGLVPQFGKWDDKTVLAFGGYATVGYTADVSTSPRVGLHYAYASGDGNPANDTSRTFDGIFGAVDNYYGRMNLFSWMNLHDVQLALSNKPLPFLKANLDYHLFFLADNKDAWYYSTGQQQRRDMDGESGSFVGHEVDLVMTLKATSHAQLQAGYGLFIPGEFVRNTGKEKLAHWGFIQGNYEF